MQSRILESDSFPAKIVLDSGNVEDSVKIDPDSIQNITSEDSILVSKNPKEMRGEDSLDF